MSALSDLQRLLPRVFLLLLAGVSSCTRPAGQSPAQRYSDPLKTLSLLQAAIRDKDWAAAQDCFSREIREANASAIGTEAFYLTDYWVSTRTAQVLLGPIPILVSSARFEVTSQDEQRAEVRISYPDRRDKDMRLQRIGLVKEPDGGWKVADVYGVIRGVSGRER